MEYLRGVTERITYSNDDTGFSVIKIKVKGYADLVTVVGSMAGVNVGSVLGIEGEWAHDAKYPLRIVGEGLECLVFSLF